jgi:hypothetical protein
MSRVDVATRLSDPTWPTTFRLASIRTLSGVSYEPVAHRCSLPVDAAISLPVNDICLAQTLAAVVLLAFDNCGSIPVAIPHTVVGIAMVAGSRKSNYSSPLNQTSELNRDIAYK